LAGATWNFYGCYFRTCWACLVFKGVFRECLNVSRPHALQKGACCTTLVPSGESCAHLHRRHVARTWLSPQFPVGNTREGGWWVYAVVGRLRGRNFRLLGAWARWGCWRGVVRGRSFEFERCGPSGRGKRDSDSDAEPPSLVSRSSGHLPGISDWISWSQTWGAGWGSGGGAVVDMVVAKVQFVS